MKICIVIKVCPHFTASFENPDFKNLLKYHNHTVGIYILFAEIRAAYALFRTKVEISPHATQTSFPLAKKQVLITLTEHQEQDRMPSADFQTKHPALCLAKFSDSKNEKKIGLKFKDPALQMPLLEEELPKEGFPKMVPVVPWLCEYA